MTPLRMTIRLQQGVNFRRVIRWLDAAGNPKPLSGWTGEGILKSAYGARTGFSLPFSTATNELVITDGQVIFQLSPYQTDMIPVEPNDDGSPEIQQYYYAINLTDRDGFVRPFFEGAALVKNRL